MVNSFLALVSFISTAIISVSTGFWGDPQDVAAIESYEPAIDINDSNQAILAWCSLSDDNTAIFCSEYDGNSWSTPLQISDSNKNIDPRTKIDQSGNILCLWQSISSSSRSIFASRKLVGESWETPTLLSNNVDVQSLSFASTDAGHTVVGWINSDLNTIEVLQGQIDGTWQSVATIYTSEIPLISLRLRIANGNIYALWIDQETIMFAQTLSGFNSEWTPPTPIHASTNCIDLNFITIENGNAMVSWIEETTAELKTLMYLNGIWDAAPATHGIQTYTFTSTSGNNDFYLTWLCAATGKIEATAYSNDVWGTIVEISPDQCYGRPNIKSYTADSALICWTDTTSGQVMLTDYSTSGVVGTPITVSDGVLNINPKLSTNGTATAVAWEHYEGADLEIRVSIIPGI